MAVPAAHTLFHVTLILVPLLHAFHPVSPLEAGGQSRKRAEASSYEAQNQEPWQQPALEGRHHKQGVTRGRGPQGTSTRARGSGEEIPRMGSTWAERGDEESSAALRQSKGVFLGFEYPYGEKENHSPGSGSKGKKQNREQKRQNRRDRLKQQRGTSHDPEPSALFMEPQVFPEPTENLQPEVLTTDPVPSTVLPSTAWTAAPTEVSPAPVTSPRQRARPRHGDVMPTLDMMLFDWTDYEDLKPDVWPSPKRREKHRFKHAEGGNTTSLAEDDPCDHHLDCLPGYCCDLREHICKPHNRGLNNKCYDDCMCTEGLRCYAKFHRNRRVTRRKGRCVEPETTDSERGSFINV
ncbi:draxin [Ambystoma mexicanum]|uniref:draxin n=1 Tax=Ambystoma mexicanum TaxID=8296 RepID=UPI0037E9AB81